MRILTVLALLPAAVVATGLVEAKEPAKQSRPNVILIMTDDQGYGDLSIHGNPWLRTPNIDELASQSIRLEDYHVSPYCVPTRAALMTGRYADRTGIHNSIAAHWFIRQNETMVSKMFRDAGYATGMFGKWHLGDNYPFRPEDRGFDEVLRHCGGAVGVLNDYWDNCYLDDTYYHNGVSTKVEGYCTDVFFSAATRFIDSRAAKDEPFFVYLATNAPHGPHICPPSDSAPYEEMKERKVSKFFGMIANIDANVGALREHLKATGLDKNTIFIFATDNGTAAGAALYNAGMRGKKMSPYDGGHRVPFFLHWPDGGYAEEQRIETLTAHLDVAPTLLDLCGISQPEGVKFDGVSLRPLLEKGDDQEWPDRMIMTDAQYDGPPRKWHQTAVLSEQWRLVLGGELYDINADPGQETNVYDENPEVVKRLTSFYDALWGEIEPTFSDVAEIPLEVPGGEQVTLSYHDCINRHHFWFQNGIRNIRDKIDPPGSTRRVYWPVRVTSDGNYTIELRRWPKELDVAISSNVPRGATVYGRPAFRTTPGIGFPATQARLAVGKERAAMPLAENAKGATFQMKLTKGSYPLSGRFVDERGRKLDAFYVYVTKTDAKNVSPAATSKATVAATATTAITVNPFAPNTISFAPQPAKAVRFVITKMQRSQPCLDELEVYGPGSDKNLASRRRGATASASSCLAGYARHRIPHLNDGKYGNEHSWICGTSTGWAQIDFPKPVMINKLVFSRDRGGALSKRLPDAFEIQLSQDGKKWTTVGKFSVKKGAVKRDAVKRGTGEKSPRKRLLPANAALLLRLDTEFNPAAMRRAVEHLSATYPNEFHCPADFETTLSGYERQLPQMREMLAGHDPVRRTKAVETCKEILAFQHRVLSANPLLDFDEVLLVKRKENNLGLPLNFHGLSFERRNGYDNEIAALSIKDGSMRQIYRPRRDAYVGEVDLHFDAERMMFTTLDSQRRYQIYEINLDGTGRRQITPGTYDDIDNYDSIYLPDERIIFTSTAGFQGVPCHGGKGDVANIHLMDRDGTNIRRLCFEQDHDWYPTMLPNGRVMYLRWEYTDSAHYFSRILMHMNPDGTDQRELCGSNSYWPNSMFYARPLPGESTRFVSIVSGHHGVKRAGDLLLFDIAKGRQEDTGVVQQIPGYNKPFKGEIKDRLVDDKWPQFLHPYPLSENYFLVAVKMSPEAGWGLYLVDTFDNMVLLKKTEGYALFEPIPLKRRPRPKVISDRVDLKSETATCFIQDIYEGKGLRGVPRGSVKNLRLFQYEYGYRDLGGHYLIGMESGWDVRRLLGTVPVHEDGSAGFVIPANTPVAIQPLDAQGRALQQMRSWLVGMPGETVSCIGCHENQSQVIMPQHTMALTREPSLPEPWHGPVRGFSFEREVQPVLNRYCVGCHQGEKGQEGRPNFAPSTQRLGAEKSIAGFPEAYWSLHPYVRRGGPEGDYHVLTPLEFHANTSELIQMLEKGHHNVKLDAEGWDRLITWIDLNAPCYGTWSEVRTVPGASVERRMEMKKLYSHLYEDVEQQSPVASYPQEFVQPPQEADATAAMPEIPGWPFTPQQAREKQAAVAGPEESSLEFGDEINVTLLRIPAGTFAMGTPAGPPDERDVSAVKIEESFWISSTEVSLAMYRQFDPQHRNGFYDMHYKDQVKPGYDMDSSDLPVIRVSWDQAMEFCRWFSEKTGKRVTLPTEAQWEWACRAGSSAPFSFGDLQTDYGGHANAADVSLKLMAVKGVDPQPIPEPNKYWDFLPKDAGVDDGVLHLAKIDRYSPNAWGLKNMHGNVAEWTLDSYRSYPYTANKTDADSVNSRKTVRGGSWRDRIKHCTSSHRLAYPQWQRVYNVGFRIVVLDE